MKQGACYYLGSWYEQVDLGSQLVTNTRQPLCVRTTYLPDFRPRIVRLKTIDTVPGTISDKMTSLAKARVQAFSEQLSVPRTDPGTFENIPKIPTIAGNSTGP